LNRRTGWVAYGNEQTGPTRVVETTDGGHRWSKPSGIDTAGCALQFVNGDDGWCVALGGALGSEGLSIYRTTTSGRRWRLISVTNPPGAKSTPGSLPFECDKQIRFSTRILGFAGFACNGGPSVIYASTDGGARWTKRSVSRRGVPRPTAGTLVAAPISVGTNAAASVALGGYKQVRSQTLIFSSTNNTGHDWRAVVPPGPRIAWGADVVTPTVWRLSLNRTILATNNAGRTWTKIRSNKRLTTSTQSTAVDFVTPQVGWDTDSGGPDLLYTTNGTSQDG
jgi:photosystem II stability/assembly factor-like uncharacterized protein